MKKNKLELSIWIFSILPLLTYAILFSFLPKQVPVHWNAAGVIDRYGTRLEALGIPAMALALCFLLKWLPSLDPKKENYDKFSNGYNAFRLALALFLCLTTGVTLYAAFWPEQLNVGSIITMAMGILLCVIGNFMPKFRHNYFCGIRTPWTLASEDVWRSTHRLAGPIWFWSGLGLAVCGLLASGEMLMYITIGVICVEVGIPYIYSYFAYKSEAKH